MANKESHLYFLNAIYRSINLIGMPDDRTTATYPTTSKHTFNINLNSITNRDEFQPSETQTPIEIYTDGSRTNKKTGYGYCILQTTNDSSSNINLAKGHGHLGTNATVFQAETYAIQAALEHLQSLPNVANTPITIHSDSQATLRSLAIQPTTSKTTLACQNKLIEVCTERKVTLRWVKAHCGITGNELADQEAKLGANETTQGAEPWLPLPTSFFKKTIKQLINFHWINRWNNNSKCRQTKLFLQEPNIKLTKEIMKCTKIPLGRAIRWLTGHCFLKRHNHIINPYENTDPFCRHCNEEEETPWHIIARCGAFQHIRLKCFNLHELPPNFQFTGKDLVQFLEHEEIIKMEED